MLIIKGGEAIPKPEVIKTPSYGLNNIIGGGLWSGRYHILWGNPQAGKTTLALHTAAAAQELGYVPVIVDAEGSITDEWLDHCGIDKASRIVMRSTRLEDIMKVMIPMTKEKGSKYCFIIDSINSIVMEQFYKEDGSTGGIGIYARSQGVLFQKLSDVVIESVDHIFILIAQQTLKNNGRDFVAEGKFGNTAAHWATNIIKLYASNAKTNMEQDDDERILSRTVTWKIMKSKQVAVQGAKGEYWFNPTTAEIDQKKEIFHIAVRNGVISQSGKAWFEYDGKKYNGEKKMVAEASDEVWEKISYELDNLADWDFDVDEVVEM